MQRQAERDTVKSQQEELKEEAEPKEDNPELYKVADSLQGKIGESSLHPKTQMEESVPRSDSQGSTSSDNQTLGLGINSPELSVDKDTNNSSNGNGNNGIFKVDFIMCF